MCRSRLPRQASRRGAVERLEPLDLRREQASPAPCVGDALGEVTGRDVCVFGDPGELRDERRRANHEARADAGTNELGERAEMQRCSPARARAAWAPRCPGSAAADRAHPRRSGTRGCGRARRCGPVLGREQVAPAGFWKSGIRYSSFGVPLARARSRSPRSGPSASSRMPTMLAPRRRSSVSVRSYVGDSVNTTSPGPSVSRKRNSSSCSEPLPVSTDSMPTCCDSASHSRSGRKPAAGPYCSIAGPCSLQGRLGGVRHLRDRERFVRGHTAREIDGVDGRLHWMSILPDVLTQLPGEQRRATLCRAGRLVANAREMPPRARAAFLLVARAPVS